MMRGERGMEYPEGAITKETIKKGKNYELVAGRTQDDIENPSCWIIENLTDQQVGTTYYGAEGFKEAEEKFNKLEEESNESENKD